MQDLINKIYNADCLEFMKQLPDKSIDLVLTSPPYDNLRTYNDTLVWNENIWKNIIKELFRIIKVGGVCVWIVGDATINGSETGTSFKQALYFKEIGFNLHDTMIWNKSCFSSVGSLQNRYAPVFEYMFILSKGFIKTFNPIKDRKNMHGGEKCSGTIRNADGSMKPFSKKITINEYGQRFNIWLQSPHRQSGIGRHPAPFPENLAEDHILSWSNENDIVFDPMSGSGTTLKMAMKNNRRFIGCEISEEYCEIIKQRLENYNKQLKLF